MTLDNFTLMFPDFDYDLALKYFDQANAQLCLFGADRNCGCSEAAQLYALAHLITIFGKIGNGQPFVSGEITSKSVDGVSVSYRQTTGNFSQTDKFWRSTPYGAMYAQMTEGCGIGAIFV